MSEKRYILIQSGKVWLTPGDNGRMKFPDSLPETWKFLPEKEWFDVGDECLVPVFDTEIEPAATRQGGQWVGLRDSWAMLSHDDYMRAGKGEELLFWRAGHLYCGCCGEPTVRQTAISRICKKCGLEIFPSPSPAVLVLVKNGDKALLVHARNFTRPFFGLVAGFVETGESLEECVAREVKEETSLTIKDIRYFGSQPWPFPFNLMIGFTANYAGGELNFDDNELSAGQFFDRNNLPLLPMAPSLARQMIDDWIKEDDKREESVSR